MSDNDCEEGKTGHNKAIPMSNPEQVKKKTSYLEKLRDRLEGYVKKLPVLGLNSGKCDLNVVK